MSHGVSVLQKFEKGSNHNFIKSYGDISKKDVERINKIVLLANSLGFEKNTQKSFTERLLMIMLNLYSCLLRSVRVIEGKHPLNIRDIVNNYHLIIYIFDNSCIHNVFCGVCQKEKVNQKQQKVKKVLLRVHPKVTQIYS